MANKHAVLSWAERFALIDFYKPTDPQVCSVFDVTEDELVTARGLRDAGTFGVAKTFDNVKYGNPFNASASAASTKGGTKSRPVKAKATVHTKPIDTTATPETASKKVKLPMKRGRKGDKIERALLAVPETPVSVEDFQKDYGVSLAVLRQSKRFIGKMNSTTQKKIGTIRVRQDRDTKVLMIWKEQN